MDHTVSKQFSTNGGVQVHRVSEQLPYETADDEIITALDNYRGLLFSSSFEFPGRYRRWDMGFVCPPLQIVCQGRSVSIEILNARGAVLLPALEQAISVCDAVSAIRVMENSLQVALKPAQRVVFEEERSRQHSVFSILRAIIGFFGSSEDTFLGLYGAFGYELAFQFESVDLKLARREDTRDMVLYLPDEILVVDHQKETAFYHRYDFQFGDAGTRGMKRQGQAAPFSFARKKPEKECDHEAGEYAETVRRARDYFRRGDLFEAVPGQMFRTRCVDAPSRIFRRLRKRNPAPYGALINLGDQEYLVAASPEMYVRVEGRRVETCPISGTIARGGDPMEDAEQILTLLNSEKDRAELSMCTDVDRNDKSRICEPGSVRVIGRRQIEMYSRLIHTVDHVEGILKSGFDALDAFLSHAWAVTVTGAPKQAAIQFIEEHEKSPRRWYGGAMGYLGFNGSMNTGLTLRTVRIGAGIAEVRAGATLLFDSNPEDEERETRLKASALLDAINRPDEQPGCTEPRTAGFHAGRKRATVLMVDHNDSFVHTLSSYFQAASADVRTVRHDAFQAVFERMAPDLVVLSPGPGVPRDYKMSSTIARVLDRQVPLFGVCLGLQAIVEYFGGELSLLDYPMHGRVSPVAVQGGLLFAGLGDSLQVGRYHSLAASRVPDCLSVTAVTAQDVVMAVEHRHLPVSGVQFHPESIMTLHKQAGFRLIENVLEMTERAGSRSGRNLPQRLDAQVQ